MSTQALGIGILLLLIGAGGLGYLVACLQWQARTTCPECDRRIQARLDDAGRSEPW